MRGATRVRDLDLRATLESGQFFRYRETAPGEFLVLTEGYAILLRQPDAGTLRWSDAPRKLVERLLGIGAAGDATHRRRLAALARDPALADLVPRYRGLRVMRIDTHEAILGFICSSMSNIPRIRRNLDAIAAALGTPHAGGHHRLPQPGLALDERSLRATGVGYRAPYLRATNATLTPKFLSDLARAEYGRAHGMLTALPGIGPKVADCVCLFGLGHGRAFPVDVHVHRAMRARFPRSRLTTERHARDFAQRRWGEMAGHAQQMLFQWARDDLARRAR